MTSGTLVGAYAGYYAKRIKRCIFIGNNAGDDVITAKNLFIIKINGFKEARTKMSFLEWFFLNRVFKRILKNIQREEIKGVNKK